MFGLPYFLKEHILGRSAKIFQAALLVELGSHPAYSLEFDHGFIQSVIVLIVLGIIVLVPYYNKMSTAVSE